MELRHVIIRFPFSRFIPSRLTLMSLKQISLLKKNFRQRIFNDCQRCEDINVSHPFFSPAHDSCNRVRIFSQRNILAYCREFDVIQLHSPTGKHGRLHRIVRFRENDDDELLLLCNFIRTMISTETMICSISRGMFIVTEISLIIFSSFVISSSNFLNKLLN